MNTRLQPLRPSTAPALLHRLAPLALATLFAGCMATAAPLPAAPGAPASLPAGSGELDARWSAVLAEVGTAACSSQAECRSIAVGAKACGGPERYLAWSTRGSDEARLRQRVEAYNTARQADNERAGRISNCMMLMDPGAVCEAGRCVTPLQGRSPVVR